MTDETALMPSRTCILEFSCAWHDNLVTGYTLGGEFITVAVIAEQCIILASEGFICQRAIAAEATEAVLMVMPVFIKEFPCVMANQFFALVTCVREQAVIAGNAVGAVIRLDVLAAIQRFFAIVTVKSVSHRNFQESLKSGGTFATSKW